MKHACPICGTPTDSATHPDFPFCGEACRTKDLGNWATERYIISEPAFDEDALEKLMLDDPEVDGESSPPRSEETSQ
jgi:endogenous inhibitor of DNA gyrase (YacG/DUF329 family)